MKKEYSTPEIRVMTFESEDVITKSLNKGDWDPITTTTPNYEEGVES